MTTADALHLLYLALAVLACGLCSAAGEAIARRRGLDARAGMVLGYVLGPIGWAALAVLPRRRPGPGR